MALPIKQTADENTELAQHPALTLVDDQASPLLRFWMATLLCVPRAWQRGLSASSETWSDCDLLAYMDPSLNVEALVQERSVPMDIRRIAANTPDLEAELNQDIVYRNLCRLGGRIGLNRTELRLLTFAVYLNNDIQLRAAGNLVENLSQVNLLRLLSQLLQCDEDSLEAAIDEEGLLCASNLLVYRVPSASTYDITFCVGVHGELATIAQIRDLPDARLTRLFYRPAQAATLALEDYAHLDAEISTLLTLLRDALDNRRPGVNLMLYGPPGTGKTELASLLATLLNAELAAIAESESHSMHSPSKRLGKLMACQRALAKQEDALVLFDEAEDCICRRQGPTQTDGFPISRETISKGALTRLLETNPRPVIWISNDIGEMDPALQRRFTQLVRMASPGPTHKRRLVDRHLADLDLSEDFRRRLAQVRPLSPAMLCAAADAARRCDGNGKTAEALIAQNLEGRLEALGHTDRLQPDNAPRLPWRAECLRASMDVAGLIEQIRPGSAARICLYGAPGTGKTAWGRALAEKLEQPLMVRQASELMSPFVGITEQLIAEAFREAERDQAVLLIDEADSFLADRNQAQANWQVTEVNQFLASMEQYQGIFVATTNLLERLDQAAMRRFDFRVRFEALDADGIALLLSDLGNDLHMALPPADDIARKVACLEQVTPGDISALHRRLSILRSRPDIDALVEMLREEVNYKLPMARPIGFCARVG